jgi:type I restriction enzyme M protein
VIGSGRKATRWKTDLIPPALIVDRYFPEEKARVDQLDADAEAASQAVEEFIEEHSGEDGPLADAMEDDRITKALASKRLKVAKIEDRHSDEVKALSQLIKLYGKETVAKSEAKEAHAELDQATLDQYSKLGTAEIQSLVIDDKWGRWMASGVNAELSALIQNLVERLGVLAERYEETVGDIEARIESLSANVAAHLAAMEIKE